MNVDADGPRRAVGVSGGLSRGAADTDEPEPDEPGPRRCFMAVGVVGAPSKLRPKPRPTLTRASAAAALAIFSLLMRASVVFARRVRAPCVEMGYADDSREAADICAGVRSVIVWPSGVVI